VLPVAELAVLVAEGDPGRAGVQECLGGVAVCERLIRFLGARQTRYLARASRLAGPSHPITGRDRGEEVFSGVELTAAEVAPVLRLSREQAQHRVAVAEYLTQDSPAVLSLVETGRTDLYRAVLVDELMREVLQPGTEQWDGVQEVMVEKLPEATTAQVRYHTRRAIEVADATASQRRHQKAKLDRRVTTCPLPDGMAAITASLSADKTLIVDTVLDALADGCRDHTRAGAAPDPRTHQQRRADAFTALFTAVAHNTPLPILPAQPTGSVQPIGSVRPIDGQDGADRAAFGGTTISTVEGPCPSDADPSPPPTPALPGLRGSPEQSGPSGPPGLPGLLGWWKPPPLPTQQGRRPHLMVTVAASTLNGGDQPGELTGYGPIPATMARELAAETGPQTLIALPEGHHPSDAARPLDRPATRHPALSHPATNGPMVGDPALDRPATGHPALSGRAPGSTTSDTATSGSTKSATTARTPALRPATTARTPALRPASPAQPALRPANPEATEATALRV
jgi:hypothetical protein